MRKTGRNDPCPCGSGKKYKRCCGAGNVSNTVRNNVNNELYRVHTDLISFITNNYNEKLNNQLKRHETSLIKDEATMDIYYTGLTPWIVSYVPCLSNNETIFERFFKLNQKRISAFAKTLLTQWPRRKPSVYEVVAIEKNFVQINEVLTNEAYKVPYSNPDDFIKGSLLVGMIIPFAGHQNFLYTMIKLFERDKTFYQSLLKKYSHKDGGLTKHYPDFFAEALTGGFAEENWQNPHHEEVANLFAQMMSERNVNDKVIVDGITLWKTFCNKANPMIRKVEPYAAALDYFVQREVLNDKNLSQAQIADVYNTPTSTVSNIVRNMNHTLKE